MLEVRKRSNYTDNTHRREQRLSTLLSTSEKYSCRALLASSKFMRVPTAVGSECSGGPEERRYQALCVCVFKAPRTYTPALSALSEGV